MHPNRRKVLDRLLKSNFGGMRQLYCYSLTFCVLLSLVIIEPCKNCVRFSLVVAVHWMPDHLC